MSVRRVAVAASGGRDSSALLHCTARLAANSGIEVVALHVHHGLSNAADEWLKRVRQQARSWGAAFMAHRVQQRPQPGDSVEAWARRLRYSALATMAQEAGCTTVLLAHHRRDQAETWLLQALRGAGAAGLSAMPREVQRDGLTWCRPWLDQPHDAIEAYAARHRLRFVDDDSNADPRYLRNRLRLQVMPSLLAAFPDAERSLIAAAGHAQSARALADELTRLDLPPLLDAEQALNAAAWSQLPPARRSNALRAWLAQTLARGAPDTLVQRLQVELPLTLRSTRQRSGQWPCPGGILTLYRGWLQLQTAVPAAGAPPGALAGMSAQDVMVMDLARVGRHAVPAWGGAFDVGMAQGAGLPSTVLRQVQLRARQGGELFALRETAPARRLKKQYQSAGVPPSSRTGPLLWSADGRLLYVPGLGVQAEALSPSGQALRSVQWVPGAAD